jgi:hypothetical protein
MLVQSSLAQRARKALPAPPMPLKKYLALTLNYSKATAVNDDSKLINEPTRFSFDQNTFGDAFDSSYYQPTTLDYATVITFLAPSSF